MPEEISLLVSFVLTLMVFSYLLADTLLYRLAVAIFVGLAAAFTGIVTFESVILPALDLTDADLILPIVAASLVGLLMLKPIGRLNVLTNLALAFLVGVGAAVAVVGALTGTLIPLALDTAQRPADLSDTTALINTVLVVIGVVTTLLYFQYGARRRADGTTERGGLNRLLAGIGEVFIIITLGALYGSAILTSLTILTGQLSALTG